MRMMKNNNNETVMVIGIDHGYGNMKTATRCFPSGVARYDKEPIFQNNLLVYNGMYYQIGEEHKKSLEQTIRKLEKQQKKEARFLRSLLELDGTTRINAELAESLIESMYLYGDNRLEINFGFKGAVEYE